MDQLNAENEYTGEEENLVYAISASDSFCPGEAGTAFAGLSSGLLRSTDGGQTWEDALESLELTEPLPVTCVILPPVGEDTTGKHVIAGAQGGILRSEDNGQTWRIVVFNAPPPTVSDLAASPDYARDQIIFAATVEDGVFISRDGGLHWVAWNFGLLDLNVLCLAVSPSFAEDETLYAGTETGIFRSTNGGRAWREVELPFGYSAVLALAISPNFAQDGMIYAATEEHGLWLSTDRGETWRQLSAFEDAVNALRISGCEILALTAEGLYHSADQGQTWQRRFIGENDDREISAFCAPQGLGATAKILAGFTDGTLEVVTLKAG